jgi:hypothetical protein
LRQYGAIEQAIFFLAEKPFGSGNVLLRAVEEISVESMVENQVRCHALVTGSAARFDNTPCPKADHREDIKNDAIFFELRIYAKSRVLDFGIRNDPL